MLKNNYTRIIIALALATAIVVYPYSIVLVLIPIFLYRGYVEALLLGLLADSLYRISMPYLYLLIFFVIIVCTEYVKRKVRV